MSKRKITTLAIVILGSLLLAFGVIEGLVSTVLASGTPTIDWNVIGNGGGHANAGIYTLDGTIGQAAAGTATDTGLELCSGFWCGVAGRHTIYLPLTLRDN